MSITKSTAIANAQLDCYETVIGASAILKIRTGAPPANVAAASTGTVLATANLPSDWMGAASARTKSKSGTWEDTAADAAGTAGHFEITASDGATVGFRGTVTATGGGGDMEVDNTVFAAGQDFIVTAFSITSGN